MSRKLIFVSFGVGAILIIVLFVVFFSPSKNNQGSDNAPLPFPTRLGGQDTQKDYESEIISFKYPEKVNVKALPIEGGGDSVTVDLSSNGNPTAIIEIQVTTATETPIDRIYKIFEGYGFVRSNITVGKSIPAVQFIGSLNIGNDKLFEEVAVFENNGKVYKVQLMYQGQTVDPELTAVFQNTLATLSLP